MGGLVKVVVLLMVMGFFLLWDILQYLPKKMGGRGGGKTEKSRE